MYYDSWLYIGSLLVTLAAGVVFWMILRRCNSKIRYWTILGLMLLNLFQHLFKSMIYPQHMGEGFTAVSTAYNMCASLIILSPLAMVCKSKMLKNFVFFVGTIAGLGAVAVPQRFIGWEVADLGWEYARYYLCHLVLFLTSALPLALGMHSPRRREFWQPATAFLLTLCGIVINDLICVGMGIYPGVTADNFFESLQRINPCGLMGPPKELPWVGEMVDWFSPSVFMGDNPSGMYVPILWYAIPLFVTISLTAWGVFSLWEKIQLKKEKAPLMQ